MVIIYQLRRERQKQPWLISVISKPSQTVLPFSLFKMGLKSPPLNGFDTIPIPQDPIWVPGAYEFLRHLWTWHAVYCFQTPRPCPTGCPSPRHGPSGEGMLSWWPIVLAWQTLEDICNMFFKFEVWREYLQGQLLSVFSLIKLIPCSLPLLCVSYLLWSIQHTKI